MDQVHAGTYPRRDLGGFESLEFTRAEVGQPMDQAHADAYFGCDFYLTTSVDNLCDVRRATCYVRKATCDVRRATCGTRL